MSRILLAVFAFAATAFAQFDTATVLGTIKDATGAVIAGGKVTLENPWSQIGELP